MKNIIIAALLLSTIAVQARKHRNSENDESSNYLNFIIQIQNDAYETTHKMDDITPSGNATALRGVQTSSTFQLWTINRLTGAEYILDEKTVSAYHPTAEITITTNDPYTGVPRTRVDHPFKVSYTVNGLIADETAPAAAKSATLSHLAVTYDTSSSGNTGTLSNTLGGLTGTLQNLFGNFTGFGDGGFGWSPYSGIDYNYKPQAIITLPQATLSTNGLTENTQLTSLQADDLTLAAGEEEFTILAAPDGDNAADVLASAKVQIWPIATGTMEGVTPGQTYTKLPDLRINLKDLYPASTTYVRAYKGAPTDNPTDPIIINSSYIVLDGLVPADRDFIITELDTFITEPGSYTLELLHETPFGVDLITQTTGLIKKNGLRVIGNLNTSE